MIKEILDFFSLSNACEHRKRCVLYTKGINCDSQYDKGTKCGHRRYLDRL